jgi:hypothetical protein
MARVKLDGMLRCSAMLLRESKLDGNAWRRYRGTGGII